VESAQEVIVKTAQGEFKFRPANTRMGDPIKVLNGRAEVERVPAAFNLTAADSMEDDYPSAAFDSASNAWVAWIGYQAENEKLFVAGAGGGSKQAIAQGEFFRPSLAAGPDGKLYLAASVYAGDVWKIGFAKGREAVGTSSRLFPAAARTSRLRRR
jgi:hypothetical protein